MAELIQPTPSIIQKFDIQELPIVDVILTGDVPRTDLWDIADKVLKDRFSQIEGVARADITGGEEREIEIVLGSRHIRRLIVRQGDPGPQEQQGNRDRGTGRTVFHFDLQLLGPLDAAPGRGLLANGHRSRGMSDQAGRTLPIQISWFCLPSG